MLHRTLAIPVLLLAAAVPGICSTPIIYKDASAPVERRVDDLLSRMTLEEKVQQVSLDVLGRNANENNLGEVTAKLPAEVGTLIYCEWMPGLRDAMQRRAMEESRLGMRALKK